MEVVDREVAFVGGDVGVPGDPFLASRNHVERQVVLGDEVVQDRGRMAGGVDDARRRVGLAFVEDGAEEEPCLPREARNTRRAGDEDTVTDLARGRYAL